MELKIDKDSFEKTLNKVGKTNSKNKKKCCKGNGEECKCDEEGNSAEEIGFHKGALNTLAAERNELVKMISNVESIMQAHLQRLQELGVKIERKKE